MEFIESERGNQKLNIKLKTICGGQLSGRILSCSRSAHVNMFIEFDSVQIADMSRNKAK
jgi:hypothetical protein